MLDIILMSIYTKPSATEDIKHEVRKEVGLGLQDLSIGAMTPTVVDGGPHGVLLAKAPLVGGALGSSARAHRVHRRLHVHLRLRKVAAFR
jgi:hypothetical protein